jgi:hypothetical protein
MYMQTDPAGAKAGRGAIEHGGRYERVDPELREQGRAQFLQGLRDTVAGLGVTRATEFLRNEMDRLKDGNHGVELHNIHFLTGSLLETLPDQHETRPLLEEMNRQSAPFWQSQQITA